MNLFQMLKKQSYPDLPSSILYNEATFYKQFVKDLLQAQSEVIIESPFITRRRLQFFQSTFELLVNKGISIYILTRDPREHDELMAQQAEDGICFFEELGVHVLIKLGKTHRKLAMIDRKITYEGSLNILSHTEGDEQMRRIDDKSESAIRFREYKYSKLKELKRLNLV